jgi:hypothetical protein
MNTIVVAEIAKTQGFTLIPTSYETPVWKYRLWLLSYVKTLPFMADTDTEYPSKILAFVSLAINYQPYYNATSLEECISTDASWFLDDSVIYVHGENDLPIWLHYSKQYGSLFGFTNKGVRSFNHIKYFPMLTGIPSLSESVDPIEYSKMAYASGNGVVRNDNKYFDTMASVFGNDFNLKVGEDTGKYSDLKNISKYWIENYIVNVQEASFALKDKRELLSAKAPNTFFNTTLYPYIEDKIIDKVIPDAFGELIGVPGFCINGTQTDSAKTFKFASIITRLDHIYVYKEEMWSEVSAASTDLPNGTITLSTANAHVDGSTSKGIVKVKIDGLFRPQVNPGDIIATINSVYGNIDYLPGNYKIDEWEAELGPLADIGLYLDSQKDISEWIEQIQNGSTIGFQYMVEYDKITARLDNPNRDIVAKIRPVEILNIEEVEADYNATIYASSALVRYGVDQESKDTKQVINDEFKEAVLEVHLKEKQYECDSLLTTLVDATTKAAVIMDDQKAIRPIYRGVKVSGLKWFDRRLYDIIEADISIPGVHLVAPYPFEVSVIFLGNIEITEIEIGNEDFIFVVLDSTEIEQITATGVAQENGSSDYDLVEIGRENEEELNLIGIRGNQVVKNTDREFIGNVRCQIVGRSLDLEKCEVTFDLRQRDYSDVVASALGG